MNDCKACGGFYSCGGNVADCPQPEGADAGRTFAATVRAPAYAKPVFDALTRHCLHTGTDVGGLMGVMLAVAVRDYLEIKGVRV